MEKQNIKTRPPIVVILGHVDHGKTTLLAKIRNTRMPHEAGGITQGIGAFQAETKDKNKITFIDTPGHEAFSGMRKRGASLADIAVLVIAADDGVMPQTKESIKYLRETKVPFIVAITKIDVAGQMTENVKNQLAEEGVYLEGRGGSVTAVEVSGITGKGIDDLLEMISLMAEMQEIEVSADGVLDAVVIETGIDRRRGPVVSVVVKDGMLQVGQEISADNIQGRIRGLFDETQKPQTQIAPGMPAQILGLSSLPEVGAIVSETVQKGRTTVKEDIKKVKIWKTEDKVPVVLKADTAGSLEAIMAKISDKVNVVFSGIGDMSESDITLAQSASATVVGFSVRVPKDVSKGAEEAGVKIHAYKIIYELLQDIDTWIKERQEQGKEKILGRAEIIAEFPHGKLRIAGCRILTGTIGKSNKLRLVRGENLLGNVYATSIKKQKEEVGQVASGEEFGILFSPQLDFAIGDVLEYYIPSPSASKEK